MNQGGYGRFFLQTADQAAYFQTANFLEFLGSFCYTEIRIPVRRNENGSGEGNTYSEYLRNAAGGSARHRIARPGGKRMKPGEADRAGKEE
jgi:hypothetical protein